MKNHGFEVSSFAINPDNSFGISCEIKHSAICYLLIIKININNFNKCIFQYKIWQDSLKVKR